ncbi:MAG: chemotaxis protein CheA [Planctomycetota bacterium]|jgi:two-component system chemotaxis sensor kinase CheA
MEDVQKEFLAESHEHLDAMEVDLVKLESSPDDPEAMARVFRAMHTIKGSCGFFAYGRLEALTHAAESTLSAVRSGLIAFHSELANVLFKVVDATRRILEQIAESGDEGDTATDGLIAALRVCRSGMGTPSPRPSRRETGRVETAKPAGRASGLTSESVRIRVDLLDALINQVGELVVARNQITDLVESRRDAGIHVATQHLNRITSEMQASVMKARLERIGRLWSKFPRMVRDTAAALGKDVRLELLGRDTELDRSLVEAIADPLTHVIRNCIDHGIEAPGERVVAGKPKTGVVRLSAYQQGGDVVVEVRDDGAGLDLERIRRAAVAKGLVSSEVAARLDEKEVADFVFQSGFSTARDVTKVSGRGVGMDVVRANVIRVGGAVDLRTERGRGTTICLRLPLTLAIIPGVVVSAADRRYVIPQTHVRELVRVHAGGAHTIETVHEAPVCRLRGQLLPLVDLDLELRAPGGGCVATLADFHDVSIAVVEVNRQRYGIVVDKIVDTREIVVKPLRGPLGRIPVYSGAAVLGDGAIALILDVAGMADRLRIEPHAPGAEYADEQEVVVDEHTEKLLLLEAPDDGRVVVPLRSVARLEEFAASEFERAGNLDVVQYRGGILPVVALADVLPGRDSRSNAEPDGAAKVPVALLDSGAGQVGLAATRILDVIEAPLEVESPGSRKGVLGTIIIEGRVAEVLDLDHVFALGLSAREAHA